MALMETFSLVVTLMVIAQPDWVLRDHLVRS